MFKKSTVFLAFLIISGTLSIIFMTNYQSLAAPVFYVANAGDGTISRINVTNNIPVSTIELNTEQLSHGIAISPDESIVYYGTGFQGKSLHALDVASQKVINTKKFSEGIHGIDIHPSGRYLYVSLMSGLGQQGGVLAVIDTNTFKQLALITTDDGPAHVSVSTDGTQVWVANVNGNSVSVIDAYTYQVLATIPVGEVPNEVALSPKGDYAFVANVKSNSISVINMVTFQLVTELVAGDGVHGVTVSPDGANVWTANNHSNDVSVFDIETLSLVETIPTGSFANHISFSPDGKFAFVTHREANNVVAIDTKKYKVINEWKLGKEPHEMTLKGMASDLENRFNEDENIDRWGERYSINRKNSTNGVEVMVRLLSPYSEEDVVYLNNSSDVDPSHYFALKIDMTTHSGDLSSIPFAEKVVLMNSKGDEIQVNKWLVVNNDSHHPQYIALFDKTKDYVPLFTDYETTLSVKIRSFTKEDLIIQLFD